MRNRKWLVPGIITLAQRHRARLGLDIFERGEVHRGGGTETEELLGAGELGCEPQAASCEGAIVMSGCWRSKSWHQLLHGSHTPDVGSAPSPLNPGGEWHG